MGKFQPLTISSKNNIISVKYASLPMVQIAKLDPDSNVKLPTTFRLYFWTKNKSEDRSIDIANLYYKFQ